MCIRDRCRSARGASASGGVERNGRRIRQVARTGDRNDSRLRFILNCLLYTSDAADERSSVDLGGRRIIKKKNNIQQRRTVNTQTIEKTVVTHY